MVVQEMVRARSHFILDIAHHRRCSVLFRNKRYLIKQKQFPIIQGLILAS